MSHTDIVPALAKVPTRIKDEMRGSIPVSSLSITEQDHIRRRIKLRNRIIVYMNHYVDTESELTQRMLIVMDLDPDMVRELEATFKLTVTGDHNKMFENYQIKYYSRRCLSYHGSNLKFCATGAAIADDTDVMLKIMYKRPKYDVMKDSIAIAADRGNFNVLRYVIDIWKTINNPILTKFYGLCLSKVVKHGDLSMVAYLSEMCNNEGRKEALREAIRVDQVDVINYLMSLIDSTTIDLQNYIVVAIEHQAVNAFKALFYMLVDGPNQELLQLMFRTSAIYNCVEIADFLLTNYDFTFQDGDNALSFAANYDNVDVARLIFERIPGVDPDVCLNLAAGNGNLGVVKLSIEYGATKFVKAIKAANDERNYEIYAYFRNSGLIHISEVPTK